VHADERFTHHRPIHAGDRLLTTLHVDAVTQRAGLSMVTTRCEIADESGAPVATVVSTLAVRPEDAA
jgi:acyl dehydratase